MSNTNSFKLDIIDKYSRDKKIAHIRDSNDLSPMEEWLIAQLQKSEVKKNSLKAEGGIDIKHIGVPNICFSLTDPDDDREEDFKKQRIERGFDSSETWSLRDTIANFILPRLKEFKNITCGVNGIFKDHDEQNNVWNKVIRAFELVVRDSGIFLLTDEEYKEYEEGMDLFRANFLALWW